jgi:CO/xanthine dehydrogenase FAD-binding subunit
MKPAPFSYHAPASLEEALALLSNYGYDAKILAGGQSLIPAMNFRLAQPGVLIDLNRIHALSFIKVDEKKNLRLGAMTRQREIETHSLIKDCSPLLRETMPHIAHVQIRNRGTIGGSLAHADPAAELPAVMLALEAEFCLQSQNGTRWVSAKDFFVGMFATALAPEELLVEIKIPALHAHSGWAFEEVARRHGDYALVGVAAVVLLDQNGVCQEARIALLSVGDAPVRATQAGQFLHDRKLTKQTLADAAEIAANQDIDPGNDIHASAEFRRHLARVLTERALRRAVVRADAGLNFLT